MADKLGVRVGLSGDDEVQAKLQAIGDAGDKHFGRVGDAADKASAKLQASLDKLTRSVDPAAAAASRMASGQDTLNKAQAAGLITSDEQQRLMGLLGQRVTEMTERIEVSRREVTSFAKALAEGRLGEAGTAFSRIAIGALSLTNPLTAVAALVAVLGGAFIKAGNDSVDALNRIKGAIALSGNFAGITSGNALGLARQLDAGTTLSYSGAEGVLTGLIGSGQVPRENLGPAAALVPNMAAATGGSLDDAKKTLISLLSDPANAAKVLEESMHALDAAQRRQIEDLAETGHSAEAQRLIIDALTGQFKGLSKSTEDLSDRIGKFLSDTWSSIGTASRGPRNTDERIAQLRGFANAGQGYDSAQQRADDQAELTRLLAQKTAEEGNAAQSAQSGQDTKTIEQALAVAKGFDLVDERSQKLSKDFELVDNALNAALARGGASPDQIRELQAARVRLGTAKDNQLDPDQEILRQLAEEMQVALAPLRDRAALTGENRLTDEFRRNAASGNPQSMAIYQAGQNTLGAQLAQPTHDAIEALEAQAEAERRLAAAWDQGSAAAEKMRQVNDALEKGRTGAIRDETAYADALARTAQADALAAAAQARAGVTRGNEDLARLAGAGGDPAALAAARRTNQAMQMLQPEADTVSDSVSAANYQRDLQYLQQKLTLADQLNATVQANQEDAQLQRTLQEKQLELQLMGENAEQRARELADIQTKNELMAAGWTQDMPGFADELAKRIAINEQIAQSDALIKQAENADKQWQSTLRTITDQISSSFERATESGKSLRQVWQGLEQDLENLILKLAVFNPLQNALGSLIPGSGTQQAPSLFSLLGGGPGGGAGLLSGLFGGNVSGTTSANAAEYMAGSGSGGGFLSGIGDWFSGLFAKGGVFDQHGLVRYFASGGVYNAATAFATASGIGVMGEAGPEAAMPLVQMPGGQLGVSAAGSGGGATNHFYVDARGADPSVLPRLQALVQQVAGINASIEGRAINAVALAARAGIPVVP